VTDWVFPRWYAAPMPEMPAPITAIRLGKPKEVSNGNANPSQQCILTHTAKNDLRIKETSDPVADR
jgi:hypothetical protein